MRHVSYISLRLAGCLQRAWRRMLEADQLAGYIFIFASFPETITLRGLDYIFMPKTVLVESIS